MLLCCRERVKGIVLWAWRYASIVSVAVLCSIVWNVMMKIKSVPDATRPFDAHALIMMLVGLPIVVRVTFFRAFGAWDLPLFLSSLQERRTLEILTKTDFAFWGKIFSGSRLNLKVKADLV